MGQRTMKLLDYINKQKKMGNSMAHLGSFINLSKLNLKNILGTEEHIHLNTIDQLYLDLRQHLDQLQIFCLKNISENLILQLKLRFKKANALIQDIYQTNKQETQRQELQIYNTNTNINIQRNKDIRQSFYLGDSMHLKQMKESTMKQTNLQPIRLQEPPRIQVQKKPILKSGNEKRRKSGKLNSKQRIQTSNNIVLQV